jgi:hypothetical protein
VLSFNLLGMRLLQLGHLSRELLSQLLYPGAALSLHLLKALLLSVLKDFQLLLMVGFLGLQLLFFGLGQGLFVLLKCGVF